MKKEKRRKQPEGRRALTAAESLAASNLRLLWDTKKSEMGLTQELAAYKLGWKTQGAVNQYLNGKIPLKIEAILKFASLLNVDPIDISEEIVSGTIGSQYSKKKDTEYGKRLKEARKRKGLSQEQLAKKSGVGQGSISKIERGDQDSSAYDIELALALDVSPLWLKKGAKRLECDSGIGMVKMDIHETRRRNLWMLIHPNGYSKEGVSNFAKLTGKTVQCIRYLVAKSPDTQGIKGIGYAAAKEFERLLSKPNGWLDKRQTDGSSQASETSGLQELMNITTPSSNAAIEKFIMAAKEKGLSDSDWRHLTAIIQRFE